MELKKSRNKDAKPYLIALFNFLFNIIQILKNKQENFMRNFLKIFVLLLSPIIALAYSDAKVFQKIEKDLGLNYCKRLKQKTVNFSKRCKSTNKTC